MCEKDEVNDGVAVGVQRNGSPNADGEKSSMKSPPGIYGAKHQMRYAKGKMREEKEGGSLVAKQRGS